MLTFFSLGGINTIRAYKKQEDFFKMEKDRLELHNRFSLLLPHSLSCFSRLFV